MEFREEKALLLLKDRINKFGVFDRIETLETNTDANTALSHQQNTDTALDEGSANEVTSSELRAFIDTTSRNASRLNTGQIDASLLPAGALSQLKIVADQTARFTLTTSDVQVGDTVKQDDNGELYYVVDETNLNNSTGYKTYNSIVNAAEVLYSNTTSGITATDIQTAVDEVESRVDTLEADSHVVVTISADDPTQQTLDLTGQELTVNLATTTTDGVLSAEDKTKLDSVESGATKNPDMKGVITVDETGIENPGFTYTSLEDAITYANANATSENKITILLTCDITITSNIVINNPYVRIVGTGKYGVTINVDDGLAGTTIIDYNHSNGTTKAPFANFNIHGSAILRDTAGTIAMNIAAPGVTYIDNLRIKTFDICVNIDDNTKTPFVFGSDIVLIDGGTTNFVSGAARVFFDNFTTIEAPINMTFKAGNESRISGGNASGNRKGIFGTGFDIQGSADIVFTGFEFDDLVTGGIVNDNTINPRFNSCFFNKERVITSLELNVPITIISNGTEIDLTTLSVNSTGTSVQGTVLNQNQDEPALLVAEELVVGTPQTPVESSFGEGDSYYVGMSVYTFDGSVYTDISTEAKRSDGTTFTFPNNTVDNAIYFANDYGLKYTNLKIELTQNADIGSGQMVWEYWDGAAWVEVNHMSFKAEDSFLPYANDFFENGTNNYHVFDDRIETDWATNDPMSTGLPRYWLRVKITSAVTTLPIFDRTKIGTSRTSIEFDGNNLMYGFGRYIDLIPSSFLTAQGGNSAPDDQNLFRSDEVFAGLTGNSFASGKDNSTGTLIALPFNLDTSCPLRFHLVYNCPSVDTGGITWSIKWDYFATDDITYLGKGSAPATTATQKTVTRTDTVDVTTAGQTKTSFFDLEVPEVVTQRIQNGNVRQGDVLMLTLYRLGNDANDTYTGTVNVINFLPYYTAWRLGGHIRAEL